MPRLRACKPLGSGSREGIVRKYLVTGGAGFIGSNFIRLVLEREPDAVVVNLDAMTYAGVPMTVAELEQSDRHTFVHGDIRDAALVDGVMADIDTVVHFAAESHVDRSILGPATFLETNVVGTGVVLDAAYRHEVETFIHVSTDEVYGSIAEGFAPESAQLKPSSPYSSSKAGSDLIALSYAETYDYPVVVTRCYEQLRALPVPGEGHPVVCHQPHRGSVGAPLRRRAQRTRLAVCRGPLLGDPHAG